jgi:uncharacterized protein (DUF4415 family)
MKKAKKFEFNFGKAKRGPVISVPKGKTRITIRLDNDVLDWFREQVDRAGGGNYQTLINETLREHIRFRQLADEAGSGSLQAPINHVLQLYLQRTRESLEAELRRMVRAELKRVG